jgi:hypothetical protein
MRTRRLLCGLPGFQATPRSRIKPKRQKKGSVMADDIEFVDGLIVKAPQRKRRLREGFHLHQGRRPWEVAPRETQGR